MSVGTCLARTIAYRLKSDHLLDKSTDNVNVELPHICLYAPACFAHETRPLSDHTIVIPMLCDDI
jgi:hypothetical protein